MTPDPIAPVPMLDAHVIGYALCDLARHMSAGEIDALRTLMGNVQGRARDAGDTPALLMYQHAHRTLSACLNLSSARR